MRSAQSTQQKESELRNSRSCHICLKKQAEKNAACTVNSAEGALWAARADSPPLNQILKDQVTNWKKSPSILKIIPLTKLLRCELERLNKATSRHLHLVPACHVFESTFKNQASTALEEVFGQIRDQASTAFEEISNPIQDQASTALEEISNPIQDQASMTLEEISSPIQDQAPTALGSTSTIRDFKTHLLHMTSTCSRRIKKAFFVLRSSFFQDRASTALGSTIIHLQDQAPTALEESVLRSSLIVLPRSSPTALGSTIIHLQDQAPTALEESVLRSSLIVLPRSSPTALGSTIIHLQDQAPTALEESVLRSSFFVHRSSKIKPDGPWINNHPPSRSSPDGP
ncbi:hypothetical protein EV1_026994 [Malus domestica]